MTSIQTDLSIYSKPLNPPKKWNNKYNTISEAELRKEFINPLLSDLRMMEHAQEEVQLEISSNDNKDNFIRLDYVIYYDGIPFIVIEAKKPDSLVSAERYNEQLKKYCWFMNVKIGVITNYKQTDVYILDDSLENKLKLDHIKHFNIKDIEENYKKFKYYYNYKQLVKLTKKYDNNDSNKHECNIISTKNGHYRITKRIQGKTRTFGTYINKYDAIKRKRFLQYNNWDLKYTTHDRNPCKKERYIKKLPHCYQISKSINGTEKSFGTYSTYEDAVKQKRILEAHNWNPKYKKTIYSEKLKQKKSCNIRKTASGNYQITKTINNQCLNWGTFNTEEEAIYIRDYLKKYVWDRFKLITYSIEE